METGAFSEFAQMRGEYEKREKPHAALKFSWDDLLYIEKKALGFRKVHTEAEMYKQKQDGFIGDAISLCSFGAFLSTDQLPDERRLRCMSLGLYTAEGGVNTMDTIITTAQKDMLIESLLKAVSKFIEVQYVTFSRNKIFIGMSVRQVLREMAGHNSFLIVRDQNAHPCARDIREYFGLGKFGKQYFSPEQVLETISATEIIDGMNISEDEQNGVVDEKFFQKICDAVSNLLVLKIQRMRQSAT